MPGPKDFLVRVVKCHESARIYIQISAGLSARPYPGGEPCADRPTDGPKCHRERNCARGTGEAWPVSVPSFPGIARKEILCPNPLNTGFFFAREPPGLRS